MNVNKQKDKGNISTQESSKGIFSKETLKNRKLVVGILIFSPLIIFKIFIEDKTIKILDNNGVPDIVETGEKPKLGDEAVIEKTGLKEKIDPNTVFEIERIVDLKDGEALDKYIPLKQISLLFRKDIENGTLLPIDTKHVPIGTLIKEFVNGNGDIYYTVQFPKKGYLFTSNHFLGVDKTKL